MTAALGVAEARPPSPPGRAGRRADGQLIGAGRLLRAALRRDRVRLAVWAAALPGFVYTGLAAENDL
ncbi:MAG: hypothetical protein LBD70_07955, partial [Bifidobacteriaceae bacterium]|nr:hypothetical protein [Bifidobacteriaceae bacterium]